MQNFMKTIINAVQGWTKKEIKNSVADWNQNDSSADNYVKNRTHWEENGVVHKIDKKYLPELTSTPDWNQSDPDAKDYIKNRPFYEDYVIDEVLFDGDITLDEYGQFYFDQTLNMQEGLKYVVVFDDATFEVTSYWDDVDGICVYMQLSDNNSLYIYNTFLSTDPRNTTHYLKLYRGSVNLVKIDNKFLNLPPVYHGNVETSMLINDINNVASGEYSLADGHNTTASTRSQHVSGEFNIIEEDGIYKQTETISTSYLQVGYLTSIYYSNTYSFDKETGIYTLTGNVGLNPNSSIYTNKSYYFISGGTSGAIMYHNAEGGYVYSSTRLRLYAGAIKYGSYNTSINRGQYVSIIGNGTSDYNRSNAHTLDWDGNSWFSGNVKVGGTGYDDEEAKELATREYVDEYVNNPDIVKDYIILKDSNNGYRYKIYMQDGNIVSRIIGSLEDFTYTVNSNGERTITGWKQTLYGEPSTKMIIPEGVIL